MGFETKPNLVDSKFEQCSGDVMSLSGRTQIIGVLDVHPNGCIDSCSGYRISGSTILRASNSSIDSVYLGAFAGSNGSGAYNFGVGCQTLLANTSGNNNIAMGFTTMKTNTTGCYNVAVGSLSLFNNLSGHWNTAIGLCALGANSTGCNNVALGNQAGAGVLGCSSVFIGAFAGCGETGSGKLYIANNAACTLIYGDFTTNIVTLPTVKLCIRPTIGSTSDDVLIYNSGTTCVQRIAASTLIGSSSKICTMTITGNGTATGFTLNHALNTQYPMVQVVKDVSPYPTIYTDNTRPNANCVCVMFDTAPVNGLVYKVLIIK